MTENSSPYPILCINLPNDPVGQDRKERMQARFAQENLSVTFIEAIPSTSSVIDHYGLDFPVAEGDSPEKVRRVISCFASHLKAIRYFLRETTAPKAIICEDDLYIAKEFTQKLTQLEENIPSDCPLVSLGYLIWYWDLAQWAGNDPSLENLCHMNGDVWGTQAYLIGREYAEEALMKYDQVFINIETELHITSELITRESQGLFAYPPLVLEDCQESIIGQCPPVDHKTAIDGWDKSLYNIE